MQNTQKNSEEELHEVHFNIPQMEYAITKANMTTVLMGRGAGKSKVLAMFLKHCAESMPRSTIRFCAYTYAGLLTNILPGIVKSWRQDYQYRQDVHFWLHTWPDKRLGIPKPYFSPETTGKYLIPWWNGSVIILTSMDRTVNNGSDFDAAAFDEVRLYRNGKLRVNELLRAKRGNNEHFGDLAEHGAVIMATDQPQNSDGNWIFEYEDKVDEDLILAIQMSFVRIEQIQVEIDELLDKEDDLTPEEKKTLEEKRKVKRILEQENNELRKDAVHCISGSTLENVHALGLKYIEDASRVDDFEWDTAILNIKLRQIKDGFYAKLNRDTHGYHSYDYDYIDAITSPTRVMRPNWRWYTDYDNAASLHIACDHNNAINWIVTGQPFEEFGEVRIQSALYVESPAFLKELIAAWLEFYKDYPNRTVYYYYDNTMVDGNSRGDKSESEVVIDLLRAAKWQVVDKYLGQASYHHSRYLLWDQSLSGHEMLLLPKFNQATCDDLLTGMELAPVKKMGATFKKDKSSERFNYKTNQYPIAPKWATHSSEAADTLITGINRERFQTEDEFMDVLSL